MSLPNVIIENGKLFTVLPSQFPAKSVYGEKITQKEGKTVRAWSPYRSKLAAAILRKTSISLSKKQHILYLGAATGTTVSHLSDILTEGRIYAVEISPFAVQKLVEISIERTNIIPILADAFHPERYSIIVPEVDIVYQDIAQRNQVEIFIRNCDRYLKRGGHGIIMVKARSIDVSLDPIRVYENVRKKIYECGYKIVDYKRLDPYTRDHSVIVITR